MSTKADQTQAAVELKKAQDKPAEVKASDEVTREEAENARRDAPKLSKVLARAFQWHEEFNKATKTELARYLEQIQKLAKDGDPEKAYKEIFELATRELELFKKLNALIAAKNKNEKGGIWQGPWSNDLSPFLYNPTKW